MLTGKVWNTAPENFLNTFYHTLYRSPVHVSHCCHGYQSHQILQTSFSFPISPHAMNNTSYPIPELTPCIFIAWIGFFHMVGFETLNVPNVMRNNAH